MSTPAFSDTVQIGIVVRDLDAATGTPLSASFRIATIWVSLNFDFRMTAPDVEQSTFGGLATGGAYDARQHR